MTIISKAAGGLSLISCIKDIHSTAKLYAKGQAGESQSDTFIATAIGASKQHGLSVRDAQRKNWILKKDFLSGPSEVLGYVKGYAKGVKETALRYVPSFVLSTLSIFAKNKKLANISALALGTFEVIDFIKNSTRFGHRTDYLK